MSMRGSIRYVLLVIVPTFLRGSLIDSLPKYRKHRPDEDAFEENAAAARLQYAKTAILEGVRERHRKWTWRYFAERRDDRHRYTDLFQKKLLAQLYAPVSPLLSSYVFGIMLITTFIRSCMSSRD